MSRYRYLSATVIVTVAQWLVILTNSSSAQAQTAAPSPEGSHWGVRNLIANSTLTFGINNIFDTRPPYSADWYQGYDPSSANYIQRYFWMSLDKKF